MDRLMTRASCLNRRRFLRHGLMLAGLSMLAGCSSLAPRAPQPEKIRRMGFLAAYPAPAPTGTLNPSVLALLETLRTLGWVEGQNLVVDYRFGEFRDERLPGLATELVGLGPDVIVASSTTAALAARDITHTIPIVMPTMLDPVGSGLVESLAHPGGNVTGLSFVGTVLSGKRLELFKQMVPTISEVAVLWSANNVGSANDLRETQAAAARLSLRIRSVGLHGSSELDGAFAALASNRPDGLLVLPENLTYTYSQQFIDFAALSHLPAMYPQAFFAAAGGLMAYGPDNVDLYRRSAAYVDKLFRGASAADLPVEQPAKLDFVVNLKTAQALGLTVPQSVLEQATELIR